MADEAFEQQALALIQESLANNKAYLTKILADISQHIVTQLTGNSEIISIVVQRASAYAGSLLEQNASDLDSVLEAMKVYVQNQLSEMGVTTNTTGLTDRAVSSPTVLPSANYDSNLDRVSLGKACTVGYTSNYFIPQYPLTAIVPQTAFWHFGYNIGHFETVWGWVPADKINGIVRHIHSIDPSGMPAVGWSIRWFDPINPDFGNADGHADMAVVGFSTWQDALNWIQQNDPLYPCAGQTEPQPTPATLPTIQAEPIQPTVTFSSSGQAIGCGINPLTSNYNPGYEPSNQTWIFWNNPLDPNAPVEFVQSNSSSNEAGLSEHFGSGYAGPFANAAESEAWLASRANCLPPIGEPIEIPEEPEAKCCPPVTLDQIDAATAMMWPWRQRLLDYYGVADTLDMNATELEQYLIGKSGGTAGYVQFVNTSHVDPSSQSLTIGIAGGS